MRSLLATLLFVCLPALASVSRTLSVDSLKTPGGNLFQIPTSNGSGGQFLQTNGSGVTSWASPLAANPPEASALQSTNIDVTNPGTDTFDGVTLTTGLYLFLTGQSTGTENGLWIFDTSSTPLTRPPGWTTGSVIPDGQQVYIDVNGTIYGVTTWVLGNAATIDTDPLVFYQLSGANGWAAFSVLGNASFASGGVQINSTTGGAVFSTSYYDGGGGNVLTYANAGSTQIGGANQEVAFFNTSWIALAGNGGTTSGFSTQLRFYDDGSPWTNYIAFRAPTTLAGNTAYILPATDAATSGDVFSSDAAGNLSWVTRVKPDLSNIASTAASDSINPGADDTIDLGASSFKWRNVHAETLMFGGDTVANLQHYYLYDSGGTGGANISIAFAQRKLNDNTGTAVVDWSTAGTVDFNNAVLKNAAGGTGTISSGTNTKNVTDANVTASSKVFVVINQNDATAVLKNVVPGSGSFTINLTVNATSNTTFAYFVIN